MSTKIKESLTHIDFLESGVYHFYQRDKISYNCREVAGRLFIK